LGSKVEMPIRCPIQSPENAELLLAWCARKLDPETSALLERHIEHCPECRAFADQQRAVWEALDAWEAAPVSEDFDVRLFQRIGHEPQARRRGVVSGWLRFRVPVAAASLLLAAVLLLRSPHPLGAPDERVGISEVENAEMALEDIEMLRTLGLMARGDAPAPPRM
jgi:anti-sigma factor RsiW